MNCSHTPQGHQNMELKHEQTLNMEQNIKTWNKNINETSKHVTNINKTSNHGTHIKNIKPWNTHKKHQNMKQNIKHGTKPKQNTLT